MTMSDIAQINKLSPNENRLTRAWYAEQRNCIPMIGVPQSTQVEVFLAGSVIAILDSYLHNDRERNPKREA
jgi:hypothetical protein